MANKITSREQDFSQWYQDIIIQAQLADYSPVKGCMVIRPNGYAIWEAIQAELNQRIRAVGVRNAYFPLFIPESFLQKEAEHVEGFAPQCAVVTHAGGKALEERLVVRPTSETMIHSMFAKWIQSYRDLPVLMNQWANVVRWEMKTKLFLRTSEFLWQEGHTCHATALEARARTLQMLTIYRDFSEEVLAMPVLAGLKSESEKFAGAEKTYSIEAMMQDRKALQAGTSHDLAQHFSKAFQINFLDREGARQFVYQTSWGVSTRLIGGVIMTHSDDRGLVLPPRLASIHVVIVPIFSSDPSGRARVLEAAERLQSSFLKIHQNVHWPYPIQVHLDRDETKLPGWKFHEYELLGVPIRIELGTRDLDQHQAVVVRRDDGKKQIIAWDQIIDYSLESLALMQTGLFQKAKERRDQASYSVENYLDFKKHLESVGGFFTAPWCQSAVCEAQVKKETHATLRCLLLDSEQQVILESKKCMVCGQLGEKDTCVRAVFAKSY